jgi:dihydrofolate reductase
MRRIVYYVAMSIDGYIAKPGDDISGYVGEGDGVQKYFADLAMFDTVVMGKRTYEFGYKYGLKPGQPAYAHMKHYIFSNTLKFETQHSAVYVCKRDIETIKNLKREDGSDIYLCGGGEFAGWLLDHAQIDLLKIKLNPLIAGAGVRLFGSSVKSWSTELIESNQYNNGLQILTYKLKY